MFIVKGLHSPLKAALIHKHINTIRASQWYVIQIRWLINHRRGTGLTVKVTEFIKRVMQIMGSRAPNEVRGAAMGGYEVS